MAGRVLEGSFGWLVDTSRLKVEQLVGEGLTANVYKGAYHGEAVAIKHLAKNALPQQEKYISRELSILTKVTHPNLVRMIGCSLNAAECLIVLELCQGGGLYDLLYSDDEIYLTWNQQLKMCTDVARGMEHLHGSNIIHRDLKSLNLLLAKPVWASHVVPEVKIADFGSARISRDDCEQLNQRTASPVDCNSKLLTQSIGTLHWMAPEMLSRLPYDERVDVYSYAMVLYEIVGMEVPFEDEAVANIPTLVCQGVRPTLEAIPPDCPSGFTSLLKSCWHSQPSKRPDFTLILAQLLQLAASEPCGKGACGKGEPLVAKVLSDATSTADTLPDFEGDLLDIEDEPDEGEEDSDVD